MDTNRLFRSVSTKDKKVSKATGVRFAGRETLRHRSRERTLRWEAACRPREIESLGREPKEWTESH